MVFRHKTLGHRGEHNRNALLLGNLQYQRLHITPNGREPRNEKRLPDSLKL